MKQQLAQAVAVFTDALCKVPGTQLQHIEKTLRQLREDLTKSGIGVLAELDDLIEEAAIAHFEDMAYYNGMLTPEQEEAYFELYCDEPDSTPYDDMWEDMMKDLYHTEREYDTVEYCGVVIPYMDVLKLNK